MIRELEPGETALAFEALATLRPALASEADLVARVDGAQRTEGYRIVGAFEDGRCVAAAGFRCGHNLAWGHFLYVDDLSTVSDARGRGHAGRLMTWRAGEAERLGCDQLHLDSGFGAARADAHRLYLRERLQVASLHFARSL